MKKSFLRLPCISFLFSLMTVFTASASDPLIDRDQTFHIQKIMPDLYMVMEKLSSGNLDTWKQFEKNIYSRKYEVISQTVKESKSRIFSLIKDHDSRVTDTQLDDFETFHTIKEKLPEHISLMIAQEEDACFRRTNQMKDLETGYMAFRHSLEMFNPANKKLDIWIAYAYACSDEKSAPMEPFHLSKMNHVEMVVTVLTSPGCPFSCHMGISRNPYHMTNQEGLPLHKNISIPLHAFAAHTMQNHDATIQYIMSKPAFSMQNIFTRELPRDVYHLGFAAHQSLLKEGIDLSNYRVVDYPCLGHPELSQSLPTIFIQISKLMRPY